MQTLNAFIQTTPNDAASLWCVYEHHLAKPAPQPPEIVYIGACLLRDAWTLTDARNNSEWAKLFADGSQPIGIHIVSITNDRHKAQNAAVARVRTITPMPRCNVYGHTLFGATRSLLCSNGQTYANQTEAASMLNVSQSAISQHMRGTLKSVKGYTFAYKD
jgi:hypothetical protein